MQIVCYDFYRQGLCPLVLDIECIEPGVCSECIFHHHKEETHNICKPFTSL